MENIKTSVVDGKLIIEVDLNQEVRETGRGNCMVATTNAWVRVPDCQGFNMNLAIVKKQYGPRGRW